MVFLPYSIMLSGGVSVDESQLLGWGDGSVVLIVQYLPPDLQDTHRNLCVVVSTCNLSDGERQEVDPGRSLKDQRPT